MEIQKNSATASNLQDLISQGRKILMRKSEGNYFVQIRFNHLDTDGTRKWRVIMDGLEFQVSEIMINAPSRTESEFYEDLGGFRHHIVTDTPEIIFEKLTAYIN